MTQQGYAKRDQFTLLEECGFITPLHGLVMDVWKVVRNPWLVVYDDELKHCGEGKTLWPRTKAALEIPSKYCSIFIPTTDDPLVHSVSRRLLAVGERMWWLRYESDDWMSNHAENVDVSVVGETLPRDRYELEGDHDFTYLKDYPLFAIDFVETPDGRLMAIDFNSAPGLKSTGMEDILPAKEVVDLIKSFMSANQWRKLHEQPTPC